MPSDSPTIKRCRKAAMGLGWVHPFFLMPLAKIRFREESTGTLWTRMGMAPTMAVTADGVVYVYPDFVASLPIEELQGVIAHEVMHVLMNHYFRRADRDPLAWNIATDMAINHALRASGIRLPAHALFPPSERRGWHAERIYQELMQDASSRPQNGGDGQGVKVGAGCGPAKPEQEAGDPTEARSRDAEIEREWREVAAAARELAKSRGDGQGNALVDALTIPEPRVRWSAILRRGTALALTAHGRDSQTWSRRGRRSQSVGPQFPGWQATAAKVAIVIDTSGSMSDDELAQCVAESVAISRNTGVALYLVTHDHGVQWEGWLTPGSRPERVQQTLRGRGGTCAREAYERVSKASRRFDTMIHLTDGGLSWPSWPANVRKPIVALTGYGANPAAVPDGALAVEVG